MGIQGLLPLLKSIHKPTHLRNFAGQTLGVDAYGWLHRGTVSCAIELAQQKPTRKHIDFALSRVRMLLHFGVRPYLVFDGDYLPSKEHTEKERAARRKESKRLGLDLLRMGRAPQAHLELQKAVDVTPSMARELIEELKRLDVPYVVAPYEADSQLAYLEKQGIISGVLSEDSDLLVFGVKCLLTKLDQYGECVMVNRADFTACREISLVGWSDKEFRIMAMLSGCDYLPGIGKMGLKTAYRLVRKHKAIERIVRTVQFDGKLKVPPKYLEAFAKAERTFLYQWVFCPEARCLVNLNTVPTELEDEDMSYVGKRVEPEIAVGVAIGDLDPNTKLRLAFHRPLNQAPVRSRAVQTPDEKQGKTISEFFKPKRTPLAELDPNSFTPSPSQQRLLENQQGISWSASQAQAAMPPALNRVAAASGPSSAPQATRRAISSQWPDGQRASPKRQRLCSDSMIAASMDGASSLETAASRFFSKRPTQQSPSLRKQSRKKDEFELWSDDSAAEAAAAMTATPEETAAKETPSPKKRKKLQVYADPEPDQEAESTEPSQSTTTNTVSQKTEGETPATSFETSESQTETSAFSQGVNTSFASFKSKFSYQTKSPSKSGLRTKSAPTLTRRSPSETSERKQILGRLATSRTEQDDAAPSGEEEADVIPASSPPPDHDNDETTNDKEGPTIRGSEDLLVPNSPESVSGDTKAAGMDLSRFAFTS